MFKSVYFYNMWPWKKEKKNPSLKRDNTAKDWACSSFPETIRQDTNTQQEVLDRFFESCLQMYLPLKRGCPLQVAQKAKFPAGLGKLFAQSSPL